MALREAFTSASASLGEASQSLQAMITVVGEASSREPSASWDRSASTADWSEERSREPRRMSAPGTSTTRVEEELSSRKATLLDGAAEPKSWEKTRGWRGTTDAAAATNASPKASERSCARMGGKQGERPEGGQARGGCGGERAVRVSESSMLLLKGEGVGDTCIYI